MKNCLNNQVYHEYSLSKADTFGTTSKHPSLRNVHLLASSQIVDVGRVVQSWVKITQG